MEFRIISPQATLGNGWFKPWGGGGYVLLAVVVLSSSLESALSNSSETSLKVYLLQGHISPSSPELRILSIAVRVA